MELANKRYDDEEFFREREKVLKPGTHGARGRFKRSC